MRLATCLHWMHTWKEWFTAQSLFSIFVCAPRQGFGLDLQPVGRIQDALDCLIRARVVSMRKLRGLKLGTSVTGCNAFPVFVTQTGRRSEVVEWAGPASRSLSGVSESIITYATYAANSIKMHQVALKSFARPRPYDNMSLGLPGQIAGHSFWDTKNEYIDLI